MAEFISVLVPDELVLTRTQMAEKAKRWVGVSGCSAGAGIITLYGVFGVLTAIVPQLARVMPAWGAGQAGRRSEGGHR